MKNKDKVDLIIEKAREMEDWDEDWDEEGALPPNKDALNHAIKYFEKITYILNEDITELAHINFGALRSGESIDLQIENSDFILVVNINGKGGGSYFGCSKGFFDILKTNTKSVKGYFDDYNKLKIDILTTFIN